MSFLFILPRPARKRKASTELTIGAECLSTKQRIETVSLCLDICRRLSESVPIFVKIRCKKYRVRWWLKKDKEDPTLGPLSVSLGPGQQSTSGDEE